MLRFMAGSHTRSFPTQAFPKAFDWSGNTSVITPVNDQGECGSGWFG
jgi:C1A family cysteine protease